MFCLVSVDVVGSWRKFGSAGGRSELEIESVERETREDKSFFSKLISYSTARADPARLRESCR